MRIAGQRQVPRPRLPAPLVHGLVLFLCCVKSFSGAGAACPLLLLAASASCSLPCPCTPLDLSVSTRRMTTPARAALLVGHASRVTNGLLAAGRYALRAGRAVHSAQQERDRYLQRKGNLRGSAAQDVRQAARLSAAGLPASWLASLLVRDDRRRGTAAGVRAGALAGKGSLGR